MNQNTVPFITKDTSQEKVNQMRSQMEQPFTTKDTPPKKKLYLILKYLYNPDENKEFDRDFEYFRGTTQELYDHLKEEILLNIRAFDLMKSRELVDAPNIRISHKCSVFMFMKDTKDLGKIEDDSNFNIMEYYYNVEDIEGDDIFG